MSDEICQKNKVIYMFGLVISAVIIVTTAISVVSILKAKTTDENHTTKFITAEDNDATLFLKKGDKLNLELRDYGDGGYTWEIVTLDETVLSLTERYDSQPSGMLGDFGNDIWVFTAEKTGSTTLELECSRSWDKIDVCATFVIEVEVQ
ncbi:MAG: protease inhibitor I42 family protein [Candidatus Thermoplasmatota archaeon]|jgi:predicted secreted protein|nr:protease inhibitor I42 family protein [Candidatus Thermoplasmatota archaeon]